MTLYTDRELRLWALTVAKEVQPGRMIALAKEIYQFVEGSKAEASLTVDAAREPVDPAYRYWASRLFPTKALYRTRRGDGPLAPAEYWFEAGKIWIGSCLKYNVLRDSDDWVMM